MRSDDRWREHLRGKYPEYLGRQRKWAEDYDRDDTVKDDSILSKLLIAAAIGAAGYGLYKSGALRKAISKGIDELGEYKGVIPEAFNALKAWTKTDVDVPIGSIFRQNFSSLKSVSNFVKNKDIINDTLADLRGLREMVQKRIAQVKDEADRITKMAVKETDLLFEIGNLNEMMDSVKADDILKRHQMEIGNKALQTLIEKRSEGAMSKAAQAKLKQNGYRLLTIGDVLKVDTQTNKPLLINSTSRFEVEEQTLKELTDFFSTFEVIDKKTGKKSLAINNFDMIKDITFDRGLMINEFGKIADIRRADRHFAQMMVSASLDFHIPLIKIRPFEMVGLHNKFMRQEVKYGYLSAKTFQPILTGKPGQEYLGKSMVFMHGNVFDIDKNGNMKLVAQGGKLLHIRDDANVGYGISKHADIIRKMANLQNVHFQTYTAEDGRIKAAYSKVMEWFGLGFQDKKISTEFELFKPSTWDSLLNKWQPFRPYKSSFVTRPQDSFGHSPTGPTYLFMYQGKTFKDVMQGSVSIEDFFKQFVAGRKNLKNVTTATMVPYHLLDRLSNSLRAVSAGGISLGLKTEDLGSVQDIFKNLMLKRILPVYLGIQAWIYINNKEEGKQPEDKIANTVVNLDLAWHGVKDRLGLTSWAKRVSQLMPGGEQISDIPGLGVLDMTSTREEKEQWYKTGMEPIRKGRYWSLGNTPFTGGKIEYYAPNWYRRVISDYKWTDSQWGSRDEYFANAPFPTPKYPFAPIRHFITDPYHWEKKHYHDRPYMLSSPAFSNVPIVGPVLSATLGRLLKPQIRMHPEAWAPKLEGYSVVDQGTGDNTGTVLPDQLVATNRFPGTEITVVPEAEMGQKPLDSLFHWSRKPKTNTNDIIYVTPSGQTSIVSIPNSISIKDLNDQLRKESIRKVRGASEKRDGGLIKDNAVAKQLISNIENTLNDQYDVFSEIGGIYGFGINALIGNGSDVGGVEIETPAYATSLNKAFWDQDLGGLGGEFSEIYRRFIPKRRREIEYYNPIRNTMPTWMPGTDYFTDFQHGDPYAKIKRGEARLPGEGYEKLYGIRDPMELGIGSSFIGKSVDDIVKHFLHQDEIIDEDQLDIVQSGTDFHEKVQSAWKKKGLLLDAEVEVNDRKHNVIGFYDARILDESSPTGDAIAEIKTINDNGFKELDKKGPMDYHQKQLNFYLWATHRPKGYIYYINRDHPEQEAKIFPMAYDQKMMEETFKNLEQARKIIKDKIALNEIQRGDLYDYFDRFRILADVAPYSKEFKEYRALISKMQLTKEQEAEAKEIRKRVIEQNKPLRIYPYKFQTSNIKVQTVTVKRKIDNEKFLTYEFPDNPIELAGVNLPNSKTSKEGRAATQFIDRFIHEGARIQVGVDADPLNLIQDNTYKTIKAVVYSGKTNINRTAIQQGVGKENEDDFSPAGVHARFTEGEIRFGKVWEKFAHLNTMFHTKFLQVRSALESYERRDLYGKDFQRWEHPIRDFLRPAIDQNINNKYGILVGGLVGSLFGRTLYGKIIGATVGVAVIGSGKAYKKAYELISGEKWIPERREKERDLNEYIDILKFIKYKRLYVEYAQKSKLKENFDVQKFLDTQKARGEKNKARIKDLEEAKRLIKIKGDSAIRSMYKQYRPKYGTPGMNVDEMISAINKEMTELMNERKAVKVPKIAQKAIAYYNLSEKTMYGYDVGEPIQNILAAMPKKDRQYLSYFMKAPEEERMKILEVAPRYVRRVLEQTWGLPVEGKPDLIQYFKHHQLPGPDWEGWDENINLDLVKVKMVRNEALDISDFNIWEDDVQQAKAMGPIPLPKLYISDYAEKVKAKLEDLLHGIGLNDVSVSYSLSSKDIDVDIDLQRDKKKEIERYINEKGASLFQ